MAKQKLKPLLTSFSPDGDYLAILSPDGIVRIWNTSSGSLLAEWKPSDSDPVVNFTCMACSFIGKKHKKERGTCLLVLGTNDGDILAIDVLTGDRKWKSSACPGGIAGFSFANKGRCLLIVGSDGKALEMNSKTGEVIREFKASRRPVSSLAFSSDGKFLALAGGKMRILSWENGKELLKFTDNFDPVQYISISDDAKTIVSSGSGEKHLKVWSCDLIAKTVNDGPVLSMRHPPLAFVCNNKGNKEDNGSIILAVSESGVAYMWNLETISQDEVKPTKITVKADKAEGDQKKSAISKKSSIISARLHATGIGKGESALVAHGSLSSPRFSVVDFFTSGKNIVINAGDETETETIQENGEILGRGIHSSESGMAVDPNRKATKKRVAPDPDAVTTRGDGESIDGALVDDDLNEPTMGEKLASLNLLDDSKSGNSEKQERQESHPSMKPPSADSVNVLLKQALHADDRILLLDCLYTQDEKVIANSISGLNPSDALKLLHSLVSIVRSRGAVLVCALPWIKSLLLQHASGVMSHESSLRSLNSLYQIIESRVSTFESALQVSSCLDFIYSRTIKDEVEEEAAIIPVIFEDNDESDEEGPDDDATETDQDMEEEALGGTTLDGDSDFEGIDDMSE